MKKLLVIVLAALPFVMYAQMPGMDFSNMQMDLPEETIVNYTNGMVADYGLNEDQAAQVLEINKKYLGKVEYPVVLPPEAEEAMNNMGNRQGGAGFDMGSFSQEDRDRMMSMMNDMQERMNDIADNQEAYENALAGVLDKKQMKKWNKAKKHYQTDQRIKMEAQFGGMGGFGGGFGGDFGGFGGGMPGGGGGMPGGGFGF